MPSRPRDNRGAGVARARPHLCSLYVLWRLSIALTVALSFSLTVGGPALHAEEEWPRLPTDAEILQVRDRFIVEYTYSTPPCAAKCDPNLPAFDLKLCLAKACLNEFLAGPEIRQSAVTETEIIKAHDPQVGKPVAASYAFLL